MERGLGEGGIEVGRGRDEEEGGIVDGLVVWLFGCGKVLFWLHASSLIEEAAAEAAEAGGADDEDEDDDEEEARGALRAFRELWSCSSKTFSSLLSTAFLKSSVCFRMAWVSASVSLFSSANIFLTSSRRVEPISFPRFCCVAVLCGRAVLWKAKNEMK